MACHVALARSHLVDLGSLGPMLFHIHGMSKHRELVCKKYWACSFSFSEYCWIRNLMGFVDLLSLCLAMSVNRGDLYRNRYATRCYDRS